MGCSLLVTARHSTHPATDSLRGADALESSCEVAGDESSGALLRHKFWRQYACVLQFGGTPNVQQAPKRCATISV
eukprot:7533839-Pyramimonas_sp.AAC.1